MINKLKAWGWICQSCNCPGGAGFDCAHKLHIGYTIKTVTTNNGNWFKLYKNGFLVADGKEFQIDEKLRGEKLI